MTTTANPTDFIDKSSNAIDIILILENLYKALKKSVGSLVLHIVLWGVVMFVCLFFLWLRREIKKNYPKNISLDNLNYKDFKKEQLILHAKIDKLKDFQAISYHTYPFAIRLMLKQMLSTSVLIIYYSDKLDAAFKNLDSPTTIADTKFKLVTEAELWANRTEAYSYLM
jgi:hypothetical protein